MLLICIAYIIGGEYKMDDSAVRIRQLRAERIKRGLCIRCGKHNDSSYSTCINCRCRFRSVHKKRIRHKRIKCIRGLKKWIASSNIQLIDNQL